MHPSDWVEQQPVGPLAGSWSSIELKNWSLLMHPPMPIRLLNLLFQELLPYALERFPPVSEEKRKNSIRNLLHLCDSVPTGLQVRLQASDPHGELESLVESQ